MYRKKGIEITSKNTLRFPIPNRTGIRIDIRINNPKKNFSVTANDLIPFIYWP